MEKFKYLLSARFEFHKAVLMEVHVFGCVMLRLLVESYRQYKLTGFLYLEGNTIYSKRLYHILL
jgi:hypothetical protein